MVVQRLTNNSIHKILSWKCIVASILNIPLRLYLPDNICHKTLRSYNVWNITMCCTRKWIWTILFENCILPWWHGMDFFPGYLLFKFIFKYGLKCWRSTTNSLNYDGDNNVNNNNKDNSGDYTNDNIHHIHERLKSSASLQFCFSILCDIFKIFVEVLFVAYVCDEFCRRRLKDLRYLTQARRKVNSIAVFTQHKPNRWISIHSYTLQKSYCHNNWILLNDWLYVTFVIISIDWNYSNRMNANIYKVRWIWYGSEFLVKRTCDPFH